MIDDKKIRQLELAFRRILLLPITRGTFRQMQNAILFNVEGNKEQAQRLLEFFFKGRAVGQENKGVEATLAKFIERYSLQVTVAREVAERGEFLSLVSSDILGHQELSLFGNRIRRIDGKEYEFITDPEATIHMLQHFAGRLLDMKKMEKHKPAFKELSGELERLQATIQQLVDLPSE